MTIVEARTTLMAIPTRPFFGRVRASGFGRHPALDHVVLELEADDGLVGIGEFTSMLPRRGALLDTEFAFACRDRLIGRDPRVLRGIMRELEGGLDGGHFVRSGIEIALLVLCGKALDVPAYALLGGRCRERVPLSFSISRGAREEADAVSVYLTEAGSLREGLAIFEFALAANLPCGIGSMPETVIGTAAQVHLGIGLDPEKMARFAVTADAQASP